MMLTQRLWTRVSPWRVTTSPLDGAMIEILTFNCADDAEAAVFAQNTRVERHRDR